MTSTRKMQLLVFFNEEWPSSQDILGVLSSEVSLTIDVGLGLTLAFTSDFETSRLYGLCC